METDVKILRRLPFGWKFCQVTNFLDMQNRQRIPLSSFIRLIRYRDGVEVREE